MWPSLREMARAKEPSLLSLKGNPGTQSSLKLGDTIWYHPPPLLKTHETKDAKKTLSNPCMNNSSKASSLKVKTNKAPRKISLIKN